MEQIIKYPRTQHIEGSGVQAGDEDLAQMPFRSLAGRHLVVEEKMDGANCAVSFSAEGQLMLQSRGHFLTGGPRERQFNLLKPWASRYAAELRAGLGRRYVMFGEWLYAKHTVFYTDLPHYFMEFDIYDREQDCFLSTPRRAALLQALPFVVSVRVLHSGPLGSFQHLADLVGPSAFIRPGADQLLRDACAERGLDPEQALRDSETSGLMEGLYIKHEQDGVVKQRFKYVRSGFLQTLVDSQSHWMERPILPNLLAPDASMW